MRTSNQTRLPARNAGARFLLPLLISILAASFAFSAPALAAESCPNEQLRAESSVNPATGAPYSAQLPDCRAYELVSPPNSGGYPAASAGELGSGQVSNEFRLYQITSRGAVFFMSEMAPPETGAIPNGRGPGVFVSTRGPAGWSTVDLTPFSSPAPDDLVAGSLEGTSALIFTNASLVPEDQDNPRNDFEDPDAGDLYLVHGSKQAPELVSKGTLPRGPTTVTAAIRAPFVFNPDLSDVAFMSKVPLVEEANTSATDCYVWADVGPAPRIAGLTNPDNGATGNCSLLGMTPEGRAVFVDESGDADSGALLVGGARESADSVQPVWISGASPFAATYDGISPNDRVAYVTTTNQLQEGPAATGPSNVYAVDVPEFPSEALPSPPTPSSVTCISCGHNGNGVTFLGQSADGSHIVFSSSEGLWSWSSGAGAKLVAPVADDLSDVVFSTNGEQVVALTSAALSSTDTNGAPDIYEFSENDGFIPRLVTSGVSTTDAYKPVAVSDDSGQVVYNDTPNGEPQIIDEWVRGEVGEISPVGASAGYSALGTAGGELEDIFFEAHEPLVAEDLNAGTADIYDARGDGGFPAPSERAGESKTSNPLAPATPAYTGNLTPPSFALAELPPDTSHPAIASKPLTRAQKLSKALKSCKKEKKKAKRVACENAARKKYAPTKGKKK
jgi:hypothetical protein